MRTYTKKQANFICSNYLCSLCWDELEQVEIPNSNQVKIVCRNHRNHLCSGKGFISAKSVENQIEKNITQFREVSKAYPEWTSGRKL